MSQSTLLVPVALSCFALTEKCCDPDTDPSGIQLPLTPEQSKTLPQYRIAPITQPNYTFLRLGSDHLIEPDILDHVDLHSTQPAALNSRLTDLGTGQVIEKRLGVYVHWTLPQFYRIGMSAAGDAADPAYQAERQRQQGYPPDSSKPPMDASQSDVTGAPQFRPVPNRWIVIRRLDLGSIDPPKAPVPRFQAWIVLSDSVRNLNDLGVDTDLEIDVSPFIDGNPDDANFGNGSLIDGQAEIFIGRKLDLNEWEKPDYDNLKRVRLNVMSSNNPLFADFAQHNMNVFTMLDNFEYQDPAHSKVKLHLRSAKADYFVIGFHSDDGDDPLTTSPKPTAKPTAKPATNPDQDAPEFKDPTNADRLSDCNMTLKVPSTDTAKIWLANPAQARILCHASMYDVQYSRTKRPDKVLAQNAATQLQGSQPVSVGVTPIDALLTFCRAHQDRTGGKTPDTGIMSEMEIDLLKIRELLRGQEDDDVDGLQAAADESLEFAFQKTDSGTEWKIKQYTDSNSPPAVASSDQINVLVNLNTIQSSLDTLTRRISLLSWSLFAEWWNWVASPLEDKNAEFKQRVSDLVDNLTKLDAKRASLETERDSFILQPVTGSSTQQRKIKDIYTKATPDRFFQRKDPTLLFGNISKGWDADFTDKIQARLDSQVMVPPSEVVTGWEGCTVFFNSISGVKRIPQVLKSPIRQLLAEFLHLRSENLAKTVYLKPTDAPQVVPWYHQETFVDPNTPIQPNPAVQLRLDSLHRGVPLSTTDPTLEADTALGPDDTSKAGVKPSTTTTPVAVAKPPPDRVGRDLWLSTQPWRPIYVEWEAVYYHIPFEKWTLDYFPRYSNWGSHVLSYAVKDPLQDPDPKKAILYETRTLKGRNYLMPQGPSMLKVMLKQIFDNTNPHLLDEEYHLPSDERDKLLALISDLDIVSFPLTGLTSQLLTQFEGSHVKPLVKLPGSKSQVILEAKNAFQAVIPANHTADQIMLRMDANTNQTPYGDLPIGQTAEPMKPVTHGQLTFTKINIIDKFGQAISVIDPTPHRAGENPRITPCISDTYFPGIVKGDALTTRPNLVEVQTSNDSCPFISLPPSINQPTRLNAKFLLRDSISGNWRSCTDWDNPVVGWIVINYADQGLQIFLADGTFYREVRKGGRYKAASATAHVDPKWLPFEAPRDLNQKVKDSKVKQIDFLIDQMHDLSYLQGMFDLINQAMSPDEEGSTLPHPPRTYASYTTAIVGRPIALVNAGFSLELSHEPHKNWSSEKGISTGLTRSLLQDNGQSWPDAPLKPDPVPGTDKSGYGFKVKLGDWERNFDGMLGYFLPPDTSAPDTSDMNLSQLYTYFTTSLDLASKPTNKDPRVPLDLNSHGTINPTVVDNYPVFTPYYIDPASQASPPSPVDHDSKLHRFGILMDPFLPVHAYSAILPNKSLQLPPYIVEKALKNVTAFWRIGPILVPEDVPAFEPAKVLRGAYSGMLQADPNDKSSQLTVALPIAAPAAAQGGQGANYRFLQPYWVPDPDAVVAQGAMPVPGTHFNALPISADAASGGDSAQMKLLDGPYTMVEGYLQITKPIEVDNLGNS